MNNVNVYIGYDQREHLAAEVCKFSILDRSAIDPARVHFLNSADIPEFTREREPHQSTDFTYTRFLVPYLCGFKGLSIFCDCDFLFRADINTLFSGADLTKAVSVVKHPQYIPHTTTKMDGIQQHVMPRKNWASLMVFNNEHQYTKQLTPEYVNTVNPGRDLHTFAWVPDQYIGSLSLDWNTLDGYYELDFPRAVHYTDGGPWFDDYKHTFYSELWLYEYERYIKDSKHLL